MAYEYEKYRGVPSMPERVHRKLSLCSFHGTPHGSWLANVQAHPNIHASRFMLHGPVLAGTASGAILRSFMPVVLSSHVPYSGRDRVHGVLDDDEWKLSFRSQKSDDVKQLA